MNTSNNSIFKHSIFLRCKTSNIPDRDLRIIDNYFSLLSSKLRPFKTYNIFTTTPITQSKCSLKNVNIIDNYII